MVIERKFIKEATKKIRIDQFLHKQLESVGCGDIDVKRTPLGTRIVIHALKPGLVIGRKGANIQQLTDDLKNNFKIENPQLEVGDVPVPQFDPELMATKLASTLERGIHFRRASYRMLQEVMRAGALGIQIEVTGKLGGERSRKEKFKQGYIKFCGETANQYVKESVKQAYMKQGVIGVKIKIVPPRSEGVQEMCIREDPEAKEESKKPAAPADARKESEPEKKEETKEKPEQKEEKKETKKEEKPAEEIKEENKKPSKEDSESKSKEPKEKKSIEEKKDGSAKKK